MGWRTKGGRAISLSGVSNLVSSFERCVLHTQKLNQKKRAEKTNLKIENKLLNTIS